MTERKVQRQQVVNQEAGRKCVVSAVPGGLSTLVPLRKHTAAAVKVFLLLTQHQTEHNAVASLLGFKGVQKNRGRGEWGQRVNGAHPSVCRQHFLSVDSWEYRVSVSSRH